MDIFDEFTTELLQMIKGEETSMLIVASAISLAIVFAIARRVIRARTVWRLQAAAAAYAEREMEKQQRIGAPQLRTSGVVC
jgi:hypothetical protein